MLGIDGKYSTTERGDDGLLYLFLVTGLTCFSLPILSLSSLLLHRSCMSCPFHLLLLLPAVGDGSQSDLRFLS